MALIIPMGETVKVFGGDNGPDERNVVKIVTDTTQAIILQAKSFPAFIHVMPTSLLKSRCQTTFVVGFGQATRW
jgi:hypothetical protein